MEKVDFLSSSYINSIYKSVSNLLSTNILECSVGVGSPNKGIKGAIQSLDEANRCLMHRKLFITSKIIYAQDILNENNTKFHENIQELEKSIISSAELNNYNQALKSLESWSNLIFENSELSYDSIYKSCVMLLSILIWNMEILGIRSETIIKCKQQVSSLFTFSDLSTLKNNFFQLAKKIICESTKDNLKNDNPEKIQSVCKYIESHIFENITLSQMANYIYMTPTYFSTLFKKNIGETFSNYVNRVKMKRAYELLGAGRNVADVAHIVGYEEIKNFRIMFKKFYNMNPVDIRRQTK